MRFSKVVAEVTFELASSIAKQRLREQKGRCGMGKKSKKQNIRKAKQTKVTSRTLASKNDNNGPQKRYLKIRPVCKVTFRLPKDAAPEAKKVTIAGDFNNWDKESCRMKRLKDGDFTTTIELEKGSDYRFRYLIDGNQWENDWCADRYVQNAYGEDDSVVTV